MYTTALGKTLNLSKSKEIAAGGEGKIFEHPTDKKKVVKLYHTPRKAEYAKHLATLSFLNKDAFVAPQEVYFDNKGMVAGFDMDYVDFNKYWLFNNLFNKGFCTSNNITHDFKVGVLMYLRNSLVELHKNDVVIGDLNMYNIFVSKQGRVLFVDVDSYQTKDQPHSGVLLDEIRDWTTLNINKETDAWAYDILSFWATTFCHPFKWVVPGNKETLEQRVKAKKSILSSITGIKIPALYQPPTGDTEKQFKEIFNGRRYMVDFMGSYQSVNVQINQPVSSVHLEIRELVKGITHVNCSGEYITIRNSSGVWSLVETKIAKVTRLISALECDEMYPSNNKPIWRKDNTLYIAGTQVNFIQPIFYYSDSALVVFDYANDTQWNFDLNNQDFGIDSSRTQVFTKSIVVRDTPIQNFGQQKYLNIPIKNKYMLVNVHNGTKNAYYTNRWVMNEYKDKSSVKYLLFNAHGQGIVELDYFSYFCVKNSLIFVPDDGCINIYKGDSDYPIVKLDCSMCTRDSKLYSTVSGIVMLESNTLYLLNTK